MGFLLDGDYINSTLCSHGQEITHISSGVKLTVSLDQKIWLVDAGREQSVCVCVSGGFKRKKEKKTPTEQCRNLKIPLILLGFVFNENIRSAFQGKIRGDPRKWRGAAKQTKKWGWHS